MLRVGIVGTGLVARDHARAIAGLGGRVSIAAAADTSAERLQAFCDEFGVASRHAAADSLIADAGVDLVVITTPPSAHEEIAIKALEAGKYVLCEKPLAHTLASARRIADAAAKRPGKLSVSYQFRYTPEFRQLRWLVDNGWLGEVQEAQLARHSFIPQATPESLGWWGKWSVAGGGVLITQQIHELDMLQLVMGPAVSVEAEMDTRFTPIESEDFVQATITFADGRRARCSASVNSGYLGGGFEFRGPLGSVGIPEGLLLDDPARQRQALRAVDRQAPETEGRPSLLATAKQALRGRPSPQSPPHAALYRDIADCIARGDPLPIPADEAMSSLELCMAIYESALRGHEVGLPLDKRSLVFDGVRAADYAARRRPAKYGAPVVFRRRGPAPGLTPRRALVGAGKWALSLAGVEPATVRALVRRPSAVHGGPPVRRMPWPKRKHFDARERRAAHRLLTKEMRVGGALIYGGPEEQAYCEAFADFLGGGYADAVNSGSNAVYVALRALELEPGSEVVVPPITDPGGAMPVALNLCIPVPADSEPGTILTSAEQIRRVITDRTAAIVVAHMGGHAVDLDPILDLARARGIPVIEDCAQAHGTLHKGRVVGSMGTISAFSTMFGKQHATGGQGGVVFTRDPLLFAKVRQIADRGKSFDASGAMSNVVASMNFNNDELGMAIGRVQLAKLPGAIRRRRAFAAHVASGLAGTEGVELVADPPHCESSYWYLMLRFDPARIRLSSSEFARALLEEGIDGVHAGYSVYPTDQIWHQKAAAFGSSRIPWSLVQQSPRDYELPNAHDANARMVRVEVHECLGPKEARDLVAAIGKIADHFRA